MAKEKELPAGMRFEPFKPDTLVNHPAHYNMGRIEVIDAIDEWGLGFNDGNAVKYIARAKHKGTEIQDIEKAIWYLNHHLQKLKSSQKLPSES
jgi:hypothetical protein